MVNTARVGGGPLGRGRAHADNFLPVFQKTCQSLLAANKPVTAPLGGVPHRAGLVGGTPLPWGLGGGA